LHRETGLDVGWHKHGLGKQSLQGSPVRQKKEKKKQSKNVCAVRHKLKVPIMSNFFTLI